MKKKNKTRKIMNCLCNFVILFSILILGLAILLGDCYAENLMNWEIFEVEVCDFVDRLFENVKEFVFSFF